MKIYAHIEPYLNGDLNENYEIEATLEFNEDSTTDDVIDGVVRIGVLEGYHKISFVRAMQKYIEDYCWENNTSVDEIMDLRGE